MGNFRLITLGDNIEPNENHENHEMKSENVEKFKGTAKVKKIELKVEGILLSMIPQL